MSAPGVTAVLVNYNAGPDLGRALQSIAEECANTSWEAFVIDNASAEDCAPIVESFAPHARLIRNQSNRGFGRAVNQGLRLASAPLVLIINPDCSLMPGALATLAAALAGDSSCAIAGPRILNPDGTEQGSARGDPDMFTGLFGRNTRLRRMLPCLGVSRRNVVQHDPSSGERIVDWVSGACMLARRDLLEHAAGFDERYFLYWEDADLCRRLRGLGFRIRYVPGATATHRVGQSSRTARESSIRAFHRSAYVYYATHVAPGALHPKRMLARGLLAARCWWQLKHLLY